MGQVRGVRAKHRYNQDQNKKERTDTGIYRDRTSRLTCQIGYGYRETTKEDGSKAKLSRGTLVSAEICPQSCPFSVHYSCYLVLYQQQPTEFSNCPTEHLLLYMLIFNCQHFSAVRAASAAIPCPMLFTSNPNIQRSFSQIRPSTEGMQTSRQRVPQIASELTVREICSPRVQTYLRSVWRIKQSIWEGPENLEAMMFMVG